MFKTLLLCVLPYWCEPVRTSDLHLAVETMRGML